MPKKTKKILLKRISIVAFVLVLGIFLFQFLFNGSVSIMSEKSLKFEDEEKNDGGSNQDTGEGDTNTGTGENTGETGENTGDDSGGESGSGSSCEPDKYGFCEYTDEIWNKLTTEKQKQSFICGKLHQEGKTCCYEYMVFLKEGTTNEYFHTYTQRYGLSPSIDDSSLEITMSPDDGLSADVLKELNKMSLVVTRVNGVSTNNSFTFSKDNPAKIPKSWFNSVGISLESGLSIDVEAVKENSDPGCVGKVAFNLELEGYGFAIEETEPVDNSLVDEFNKLSAELKKEQPDINCEPSNESNWSDYEKSYCKSQKIVSGDVHTSKKDYSSSLSSSSFAKDFVIPLKCDIHDVRNANPSSDVYYTNRSILTASREEEITVGHYTYHYAPGNVSENNPITCKVKCDETVVVQYGPPVASKAGLCIEYQVQVESSVKCTKKKNPAQPIQPSSYCTPTPVCFHPNADGGWNGYQAGPDDEFDSCIYNCDGGKYTTSCSTKCYQKVYGSSAALAIDAEKTYKYSDFKQYAEGVSDELKQDIEACKKISMNYRFKFNSDQHYEKGMEKEGYYGCYYWYNNKMYWSGDSEYTPGRWYAKSSAVATKDYTNFHTVWDGFMRAGTIHAGEGRTNWSFCSARCHWADCKKGQYLNPGVAKADYESNLEIYESAVKKCLAATSCQERKTTYIMTVNQNGVLTKVEKADTTISTYNEQDVKESEKLKGKNYLLDYNGCYQKSNQSSGEWYESEWSFGGTWINNKNGQISYSKPDEVGYSHYKNQFCLSPNVKNVNQKWYNFYYTKIYGEESISINSKEIQDVCPCEYKVNSITDDDIQYNIVASTRDFGHFGWNIDVSCFYAVNNDICLNKDSCKNDVEMRVRSVDLVDLFPAENGQVHSADTYGRLPGFNWSAYATNIKKDKDYTSQPSQYLKWVQHNNYSVYDDAYLDYEIYLTREDIRNIRNNTPNYTTFSGGTSKIEDNDSVVAYTSTLLRETLKSPYNKLPQSSALQCNNMNNYSSTQCRTDFSVGSSDDSNANGADSNGNSAEDDSVEDSITVVKGEKK